MRPFALAPAVLPLVLTACGAPAQTYRVVIAPPPSVAVAPPAVVAVPAPSAGGPQVLCTAPQSAPAGTPVTVEGVAAPGTTLVSYHWSVLRAPYRGAYRFAPQFDPADQNAQVASAARTPFVSPMVGAYQLLLEARDAQGRLAQCETTVTLGSHGLRVELSWNTDRTDVDLHMTTSASPRWVSAEDAYYANRTPDAQREPEGARRWLDTDDVDGEGPENIRVDAPEPDREYRVGVHYYSSHGERDPTTAIVVVYCGERQAARFERALVGGRGVAQNDFWNVASVRFDGQGRCRVTPDARLRHQEDVAGRW